MDANYVNANLNIRNASKILDRHIAPRVEGPLHHLRIRTSKLAEEVGEVEEAIIAYEGTNPRKFSSGEANAKATIAHELLKATIAHELLDTAAAALFALYHLTEEADIIGALFDHVAYLRNRLEA